MTVKMRFALKVNLAFVPVCASSVLERRLCWNTLEAWARVMGTYNAPHLFTFSWCPGVSPGGRWIGPVPGLFPHHSPNRHIKRRDDHAMPKVHFNHSRTTIPVQQVTQALCFINNKQVRKDLRQKSHASFLISFPKWGVFLWENR